ncbi:TonB-dependent receptor [Lewinella cohaerens]|uniref:TonB-dependent receptor n=1 Tax=Lewinella cohaerens TaxID=70995 RepID=UPI00036A532F|nr:TonB-dependent receptor [Lewinella cohaerens]
MLQFARFCGLILSLLLTNLAFSQSGTISGTITDKQSGESLIAATVRAGDIGTVTDYDGFFELKLTAGTYEVKANYLGYTTASATLTVGAGETTTWNIALEEAATLLQTATVSSSKYEKPLSEVTVSLEILRPDLIESTGKLTLDDALQKVPGVTVVDGQANIRGGSGYSQGAGSRVLLLMDDVPILQADAGFPQWDDVPLEVIQQVEVIKGASSALYGSSALNGIVNVRTAYATSTPITKGSLFSTVHLTPKREELKWWDSAPRSLGASLSHRQKFDKVDLVVGGYYLNDESFRKDVYRKFGRANFNIRHRASDRLTYGLAGNFNAGESSSYFYWSGIETAYVGDSTTQATRKRFRYNLDPTITYFDKKNNRHRFLGRFYSVDNDNDRNQSNRSNLYYAEYQFQRRFENSGLVMTSGLVASGTGVEAELYGDTTFTSQNYAAFAQLDKKFGKRLNASFGFRYEYNKLNNPGFDYVLNNIQSTILPTTEEESRPVFRFGLNYQATEGTFIRASWGQGYRYPTIAEKYIFTNAGGFFIQPSPALESETGWSAEIGIKQGYRLGAFEGFVDVTAFYMKYEDMIEFNWTGSGFQSLNIGGTNIQGLEFTIAGRGKLGSVPFQLLTGLVTIDPRFDEFDTNVPPDGSTLGGQNSIGSSSNDNVLKYRFRNSFKFDGEVELGKFRLGAESFYNSHMEAIDALFLIFISGLNDYRQKDNNGYWLHNIRLAYAHSEKVKATFILGNVFNEEYTIRPALMEAPRNVTLRLDYKF